MHQMASALLDAHMGEALCPLAKLKVLTSSGIQHMKLYCTLL